MERAEKVLWAAIAASSLTLAASFIWSLPVWALLGAYLLVGAPVLYHAIRNIAHGDWFDENFLMALATVGALALADYREALAVMVFYQLGEAFSELAVSNNKRSIERLMDIRPDTCTLLENEHMRTVKPEDVAIGAMIVVKPGERIPLDGVVSEGASSLNTVALTGESLPRDVRAGDPVASGCVNLTGLLKITVTSVYGESTVAKILQLIQEAGEKKGKAERFITRFSRVYTPTVVGAALVLCLIPPLFVGNFAQWLNRALIFLVVSCPCALALSVPLTFFAGIGGASRRGVLIKGASYLEGLAKADIVAFDKTGTLTEGSFSVTASYPAEDGTSASLLQAAALAEALSDHPVAAALRAAAPQPVDPSRVTHVEAIAGEGVCADVSGARLCAGNEKLMARLGVACNAVPTSGTVVHVARDERYLGAVVLSDTVKPGAADAIAALRALGVRKTVLLSGDRPAVAQAVGDALGLDEVAASLLPADKVAQVEALLLEKRSDGSLVYVGDGINDAPVLRRVDVGVAMGGLGSDAAIEAADVVLMDDDPGKLPIAIRLARRTHHIVRQNIGFSLAIKVVILAMGAFGYANLWLAVFADVGVLLLAVANALRAGHVR